jgi:hypothetical protein
MCEGHLSHCGDLLWGNEKKLLDLLTVLEEEQRHEVLVSPSKPKGRRELKNLECSINFDARGDCSSRVKARGFFQCSDEAQGSCEGVCLWVSCCSSGGT